MLMPIDFHHKQPVTKVIYVKKNPQKQTTTTTTTNKQTNKQSNKQTNKK